MVKPTFPETQPSQDARDPVRVAPGQTTPPSSSPSLLDPTNPVLPSVIPFVGAGIRDTLRFLQQRLGADAGARLGSAAGAALGASLSKGSRVLQVDPIREIGENILSDYLNVQYHIRLTMLPESSTRLLQKAFTQLEYENSVDIDTLAKTDIALDRGVVIASTGEVYRNLAPVTIGAQADVGAGPDQTAPAGTAPTPTTPNAQSGATAGGIFGGIVGSALGGETTNRTALNPGRRYYTDGRNYYNISEMNLSNLTSPTPGNSAISTMTTMKMRIAEPHGFKLVEDIRNIADELGYNNLNRGRILYRVDLWFSGYEPGSGQWIEFIPLFKDVSDGSEKKRDRLSISYYVAISQIEATMTARGVDYDVSFVPCGHYAYRPEEVVFNNLSITALQNARSQAGTFGAFLDKLEEVLERAKDDSTARRIKRKYRFYAPDFIREAKFNNRDGANEKTFVGDKRTIGNTMATGKNTDVIRFVEQAWSDCTDVQDLFLADDPDNANFLRPRMLLTFRFNTRYQDVGGKTGRDTKLNDYDVITYEYFLDPFITFKKAANDENTIKPYVHPSNQLERIKQMIRLGMLTRIYNYIYTGLNTEVLDLNLNFKAFYYEALWRNQTDSATRKGVHTTGTPSGILAAEQSKNPQVRELYAGRQVSDAAVDSILNQIFGRITNLIPDAEKISQNINPFVILNDSSLNVLPEPDAIAAITSKGDERYYKYMYYRTDHLQNDMLQLDGMHIRGDPVWLLSPYANTLLGNIKPLTTTGTGASEPVRILPQTGRVIFLRMYAPEQSDYMNQFRQNGSSNPLVIGGFYEIIKVDSMFREGLFTQKVFAVKLNHLNYFELFSTKGFVQLGRVSPNEDQVYIPAPESEGGPSPGAPNSGPTTTPPGVPGTTVTPPTPNGSVDVGSFRFPRFDQPNLEFDRTNNPGNMTCDMARLNTNNYGVINCVSYNSQYSFAQYPNPETGVQATALGVLSWYGRSGGSVTLVDAGSGTLTTLNPAPPRNTVALMICTWCPPGEQYGNPTKNMQNYINFVTSTMSQVLGQPITQNTRLDLTDRKVLAAFIYAKTGFEKGANSKFFDLSLINRALGV